MDFQTGHFADFEQFKVEFKVVLLPLGKLELTVFVPFTSLGKTCRKKESNKNSRTTHRI